jgi:hypothetical protein
VNLREFPGGFDLEERTLRTNQRWQPAVLVGLRHGAARRAAVNEVTAHAIARVVYRMLKYKVEYETIRVEEYEQKYREQQIKYMKKTCTEPVEVKQRSSASNSCLPDHAGREKRRDAMRHACFAFNRLYDFGAFTRSPHGFCLDQRLGRSTLPPSR